jgi:hypothetical protein
MAEQINLEIVFERANRFGMGDLPPGVLVFVV